MGPPPKRRRSRFYSARRRAPRHSRFRRRILHWNTHNRAGPHASWLRAAPSECESYLLQSAPSASEARVPMLWATPSIGMRSPMLSRGAEAAHRGKAWPGRAARSRRREPKQETHLPLPTNGRFLQFPAPVPPRPAAPPRREENWIRESGRVSRLRAPTVSISCPRVALASHVR